MKEQRQVFEALAKIAKPQKEELSSERVELATIPQLRKRAESLKSKLEKQRQSIKSYLMKESDRYNTELDKLDADIKETVKKAKDIGVDVGNLEDLISDVYDSKPNLSGAALKLK